MKINITEIQIVPVKPKDGLIAFASFVVDDKLYLGSIAIFTRPDGAYRLLYPTKRVGARNVHVFYPIHKSFAVAIEVAVIKKYEEVTK